MTSPLSMSDEELISELQKKVERLQEENERLKSQLEPKGFTLPEIFAGNLVFEKLGDPADYPFFEVEKLQHRDFAIIIVKGNVGIIYFLRVDPFIEDKALQLPEENMSTVVVMSELLTRPGQAEKAVECLYSMIGSHFQIRESELELDLASQRIYVFT